jgi:transposase InsO family protein
VLICDRDGKWTAGFRGLLEGAGVRVVLTPFQAPNANAHAERFVRSIREECLDRLILFGERRLIRALDEFTAHYHRERNHQGLGNRLIVPVSRRPVGTPSVPARAREWMLSSPWIAGGYGMRRRVTADPSCRGPEICSQLTFSSCTSKL